MTILFEWMKAFAIIFMIVGTPVVVATMYRGK